MDAAGEEELNLGLDAIVTASKVTEDVASLATSLEPKDRVERRGLTKRRVVKELVFFQRP